MAYGTKEGNYFRASPNISTGSKLQNNKYALTIEDETSSTPGLIKIWRTTLLLGTTQSQFIGEVPRGSVFDPSKGAGELEENQYFSNPEALKSVKAQAETTVKASLIKPQDKGGAGQNPNAAAYNARTLVQGPQQGPTPNGDTLDQQQQQQAGAAGPNDTKKFDLEKNLTAKEGTRTEFSKILRYPENMSEYQDKLKIDMITFRPRALSGLKFQDRSQEITTPSGTVFLAIPGGISDDNRVNWGTQDMDAKEAAVASAVLQIIKNGGDAIGALGKEVENLVSDPKAAAEFKTGFAAFFAGQAAGVKGLLARTEGAVLNPNTELLFQGPALRSFSFSFKLSPRSEKEAKMVRSIIRFFKQGMAVQRTQSELFLKAPNIFKLTFLKGAKDEKDEHTFLPKIKLCALISCSVDYTPEGNYATFRDSSMVSYNMTLTFNELDPVFNDEYGNAENAVDTNVGY